MMSCNYSCNCSCCHSHSLTHSLTRSLSSGGVVAHYLLYCSVAILQSDTSADISRDLFSEYSRFIALFAKPTITRSRTHSLTLSLMKWTNLLTTGFFLTTPSFTHSLTTTPTHSSACDHTTLSITYYSDPTCQHIDQEISRQEQLKMTTNGEDQVLDGLCHDVWEDTDTTPSHTHSHTNSHTHSYLRGDYGKSFGILSSSVQFSCTDEGYSEAWYSGSKCNEAELFIDLTAAWGNCVTVGEVSFIVTRKD
jgi:hypothetical protein